MSNLDVIKETIQYEQLIKENSSNIVLKDEYLIPDTHPDVKEILCIESKPVITNKEIIGDKVVVEGKIEYTVIYLSEEDGNSINSVNYTQKFNNNIDFNSSEHKIICEVESKIEHIEASIMNERKITIQGILTLNWELYKEKGLEFVTDIEGNGKIQVQKKNDIINKVIARDEVDIDGKSTIRVGMDKPQISKILKCSFLIHKKEVKIIDEKMYLACYCRINIMYKGHNSNEIICLDDDIYLSKEKEIEVEGITSDMIIDASFNLCDNEIMMEEDDLGETRIINTEVEVKAYTKIISKEEIEIIKDAYSPSQIIELKQNHYNIGMVQGSKNTDTIVKDAIQLNEHNLRPEQVASTEAVVIITDKEVKKDRVEIEGIIKAQILYKTNDESQYISNIEGEIPFSASVDITGADEGMASIVKSSIENIESFIEGNSISVKAVVSFNTKVLYEVEKEFIEEVIELEGEKPVKNASIIIYAVDKGDTLWELAKKFNTTIDELIKINSIENPDYLEIGQKLIIPGRAKF